RKEERQGNRSFLFVGHCVLAAATSCFRLRTYLRLVNGYRRGPLEYWWGQPSAQHRCLEQQQCHAAMATPRTCERSSFLLCDCGAAQVPSPTAPPPSQPVQSGQLFAPLISRAGGGEYQITKLPSLLLDPTSKSSAVQACAKQPLARAFARRSD